MSSRRLFLILAAAVIVVVVLVLGRPLLSPPMAERPQPEVVGNVSETPEVAVDIPVAEEMPEAIPLPEVVIPEPAEPAEMPVIVADETPQIDAGIPRSVDQPLEEAIVLPPEPFGEDETHRDVSIYIATNRTINPNPDPDFAASILTEEIGDLHYATATVSIPRAHQMGHLESQNWFAAKIFSPDETKHVILQNVALWDRDTVLSFLDQDLDAATSSDRGGKSILMYVHGFNTSFDKAARRSGQLTYDLTWDGPSVLFSWPSQGSALDYFKDSTNAQDSVPAMKQVLRDLADRDAERIIVIAHSMGTRIISNAMKEMVLENDPAVAEISMVVLAAPDINARTFTEQIAPRFRAAQTPVTLYASSQDSALKASKRANGFRRIGDTTDGVPEVEGIDVIDATGATSDFFGHTYFGDNTSILSDIYEMVHKGAEPPLRPTLLPVPDNAPTHWRINITGQR